MIPSVLIVAAVIGRWWVVPVAAATWTLLLVTTGSCDLSCVPGAGALGAANAFAGVAVHRVVVFASRLPRGKENGLEQSTTLPS